MHIIYQFTCWTLEMSFNYKSFLKEISWSSAKVNVILPPVVQKTHTTVEIILQMAGKHFCWEWPGVHVENKLNMHLQYVFVANKISCTKYRVDKGAMRMSTKVIISIFLALMMPHLKTTSSLGPHSLKERSKKRERPWVSGHNIEVNPALKKTWK